MFKKVAQQGRNKRRGDAYSVRYGEPLSEARTLPGERRVSARGVGRVSNSDFFSILLGRPGVDHRGKSIPPHWSVWLQEQSPESEL